MVSVSPQREQTEVDGVAGVFENTLGWSVGKR